MAPDVKAETADPLYLNRVGRRSLMAFMRQSKRKGCNFTKAKKR